MKFLAKLLSIVTGFFALCFLVLAIGFMFNDDLLSSKTIFGLLVNLFTSLTLSTLTLSLWTFKNPKAALLGLLNKFTYDGNITTTSSTPKTRDIKGTETLTSRRVTYLYKLALDILNDDKVDLKEAEKLRNWLQRYPESKDDYRTEKLYIADEQALDDKELDESESLELFSLLSDFCDFVEEQKSTIKTTKSQPRFLTESDYTPSYAFLKHLKNGKEYAMGYEDSSGMVSNRHIVINSIQLSKENTPYIKAHCLLREHARTFRADRINNICDVKSGEVFL